jgi:hypothetical protein
LAAVFTFSSMAGELMDTAQAILAASDAVMNKAWRDEDRLWRRDDLAFREREAEFMCVATVKVHLLAFVNTGNTMSARDALTRVWLAGSSRRPGGRRTWCSGSWRMRGTCGVGMSKKTGLLLQRRELCFSQLHSSKSMAAFVNPTCLLLRRRA